MKLLLLGALFISSYANAYTIVQGNSNFTPLPSGKTKIDCTSSESACGVVWTGADGKHYGVFDGSDILWTWAVIAPPPPPPGGTELDVLIDALGTSGTIFNNDGPAPEVPGWPIP